MVSDTRRIYNRKYYQRNKEAFKSRARQSYSENRQAILTRQKNYNKMQYQLRSPSRRYANMTAEAKAKHKAGVVKWRKLNPGKFHEYTRRTYWRIKLACLDLYGHKCKTCSVIDPRLLTLNHLNGVIGKTNRVQSIMIMRKILSRKERKDNYDFRCFNCQVLFEYEKGRIKLPENGMVHSY